MAIGLHEEWPLLCAQHLVRPQGLLGVSLRGFQQHLHSASLPFCLLWISTLHSQDSRNTIFLSQSILISELLPKCKATEIASKEKYFESIYSRQEMP
jgi:hypothetical protein